MKAFVMKPLGTSTTELVHFYPNPALKRDVNTSR